MPARWLWSGWKRRANRQWSLITSYNLAMHSVRFRRSAFSWLKQEFKVIYLFQNRPFVVYRYVGQIKMGLNGWMHDIFMGEKQKWAPKANSQILRLYSIIGICESPFQSAYLRVPVSFCCSLLTAGNDQLFQFISLPLSLAHASIYLSTMHPR